MTGAGTGRLALVLAGFTFLSACEEGKEFKLFDKPLFPAKHTTNEVGTTTDGTTTTTIEKDVESPDVFQQSENGLWDGRPSLGGVWVAHPDAGEPERVIIRNEANDKFIVGALFHRERDFPGPRFQVSSDAAAELGMLAGAPVALNVTALRRQVIPVAPEVSAPLVDTVETPETVQTPETIAAAPLDATTSEPAESIDSVASIAASAIEAAVASTNNDDATDVVAVAAPAVQRSSLEKPYVQIGIFAIESNAQDTSSLLRNSGVLPTIKEFATAGKTYWRVIVGPIPTKSDRSAVIKKVKSLGFGDAYPVTN